MYLVFFFKQKTAYEMRISDWSSDVCSSDLMSRRITLPIHIDGKGPFNFVVDTGSERTVISPELASKLALAPDDPVRINSIAGITQVNTVTIPRLSYGRGMMPSVQAPVLEAINLGAPGL